MRIGLYPGTFDPITYGHVDIIRRSATLVDRLDSSIETVFLMAEARHQAIASKLVKEIARLGGDVHKFVPPAVNDALRAKLDKPSRH